jgi:hypothetical protein
MMAILERAFPNAAPEEPLDAVDDDGQRFRLTEEWFVVARRKTLESWKVASPAFSDNVHQFAFEDAVDVFGGKTRFNSFVKELLSFDFHDKWIASDPDEAD